MRNPFIIISVMDCTDKILRQCSLTSWTSFRNHKYKFQNCETKVLDGYSLEFPEYNTTVHGSGSHWRRWTNRGFTFLNSLANNSDDESTEEEPV